MDINTLLAYAGFAIGVIGIVLAIVFYYAAKEKKEPSCYYATIQNIRNLEGDGSPIKVLFKNSEVKRVSTTYIWLWNGGKKPIVFTSDIPREDPVELELKDGEESFQILDCHLIGTSRKAVNFAVERKEDRKIKVEFNFMDYLDGAVFEVQHTGGIDTKIISHGTILGVSNGIKINSFMGMKKSKYEPKLKMSFEEFTLLYYFFFKKSLVDKIFSSIAFTIVLGLLCAFPLFLYKMTIEYPAETGNIPPFLLQVLPYFLILYLILVFSLITPLYIKTWFSKSDPVPVTLQYDLPKHTKKMNDHKGSIDKNASTME